MTKPVIPGLILGALCAATGLHAQDDAKHLLRYQLKKGDVQHYEFTQRQKTKMSMGDQPMEVSSEMQMFVEFRCTGAAEGKFEVAQTIYRIKMKSKNPMMGEIDFDTNDEDSVPTMFDPMLDIIGQRMKATVDARGQVSNLAIPEELKEAVTGRSGINLEDIFSEFIIQFPEEPIAIGSGWATTRSQSMGQMGDLEVKIANKLVGVEGSNAILQQDIEMDFGDEMPVTAKVKKAESKLVIDMRTGMTQSMMMNMLMNITANRGGMQVDVEQNIEGSMKRIEPPAKKKDAPGKQGK